MCSLSQQMMCWEYGGYPEEVPMSKNIIKSRTFWLNILGLAAGYGEFLPPKYAVPILAVANIGVRILTNQPVNLLPW